MFGNNPNLKNLEPVVIMGRGHSGTRILAWICHDLGLRMGVDASRETGDADDLVFTRKIKKIAQRNLGMTSMSDIKASSLRRFHRAITAYYKRMGQPEGLWGWKFPETYLIAPYVLKTFPNIRIIHLVRDGRDLAFKNHLTDDPNRRLGKLLLTKIGALHEPHAVQAGMSWAAQVDWFDQFKSEIPKTQYLEMTFEQLCSNPMTEAQRLCHFLQVPMTEAATHFCQNRINTSKLAQHRENDPNDVAAVTKRILPTLKRYGYE